MPRRTDPVAAALDLVEVLPALIERTASAGGPLALAVYAMRTALTEARRVAGDACQPEGRDTSRTGAADRPVIR